MGIVAAFKKIRELNLNHNYNTNDIRYTKYYTFMFLIYNVIYQCCFGLSYYLLIKIFF